MNDNIGLARKVLSALGEGKLGSILGDLSDNFEYRIMTAEPQTYTADGLVKALDDFSVVMDKWVDFTIVGITDGGDRIALECEGDGRTAAGKSYRNRYHYLFEFRGGRVTAIREYMDSAYAAATFAP